MPRAAEVAVGLAVGAGLLVVLWGSGEGTPLLRRPEGRADAPLPSVGMAQPTPPAPATERAVPTDSGGIQGLPLELIVLSLLVLGLVALLVRFLLSRDWQQEPGPDEPDDGDVVDLVLAATSPGARRVALAEGDPRNAVVACWVALEDAVQQSGMARRPSETAAELAARVLRTWRVPEGTVLELLDLYREARFSRHPVTAAQRDRALSALTEVHDHLRAGRHRVVPG